MINKTTVLLDDYLRKMYEHSGEAILFFDKSGKVVAMNPQAEQLIAPEAVIAMKEGKESAICGTCKGYTSEQDVMTCLDCYLANPGADFSSFQVYLKTSSGHIKPFTASYHTIDKENDISVFMLRDLTKQIQTQEQLYQNKMTKYVIKAQEEERKRISRELHDSVAQEMLSSLVELRVLKYMDTDQAVLDKIKRTEETLTRLLDDIRSLSVELRPAALDDLGLEAAFRSYFKWTEKNYGISIHFASSIGTGRFTSEVETVMYRICQEAILNAVKYAMVDTIFVEIKQDEKILNLVVRDFGEGFDPHHNQVKGTGLGLYGMRERAELVGGSWSIESRPGEGTAVRLSLPVESSKGSAL